MSEKDFYISSKKIHLTYSTEVNDFTWENWKYWWSNTYGNKHTIEFYSVLIDNINNYILILLKFKDTLQTKNKKFFDYYGGPSIICRAGVNHVSTDKIWENIFKLHEQKAQQVNDDLKNEWIYYWPDKKLRNKKERSSEPNIMRPEIDEITQIIENDTLEIKKKCRAVTKGEEEKLKEELPQILQNATSPFQQQQIPPPVIQPPVMSLPIVQPFVLNPIQPVSQPSVFIPPSLIKSPSSSIKSPPSTKY